MKSSDPAQTLETDRKGIEEVRELCGEQLSHAVSVVMPALNEASHVAEQIRDVEAVLGESGWEYEILLVDDGSTDGTAEAAAAAGARVLRRRSNRGYGSALKLGARAARHDWILIVDADGTYPSESIPHLLALADHNDMVVGARTGEVVRVPLSRRPAKWFLRRLASYLAGEDLPDLNSGLRLIRRSLIERYDQLLPDGFSFTTTITLASVCNAHPVEYVPIDYQARLGRSKIRPRHAFDFLLLILRTIIFFNPLKVFIPLGGIVALGGIGKFVYDVLRNDLSESAVLALLAALVIWAVGLLADQNARIAINR